MRFILMMTCWLFIHNLQAGQYYVCTSADGHKSFQEKPCPARSKSELKHFQSSPTPASSAATENRLTTDNPTYQKLKANNRRLELGRAIRSTEQKLTQLERNRSEELASLKAKKAQANNNLAGATWEQSISSEMQAVNERYNSLVETERQSLAKLQDELKDLLEK